MFPQNTSCEFVPRLHRNRIRRGSSQGQYEPITCWRCTCEWTEIFYQNAPQWMFSHQSGPAGKRMGGETGSRFKIPTDVNTTLHDKPTFTVIVTVHCPKTGVRDKVNSRNTIPTFPVDSHLWTTVPLGSCVRQKNTEETSHEPDELFNNRKQRPTWTEISTAPL